MRKISYWSELFRINKIIKVLLISEVLLSSGYGFVTPIFAVFLTDNIVGGSLVVVGIADAIYLATKSLVQIPIGAWIDRTEGEEIDFWLLLFGSLLMGVASLLYIWARLPIHIYLIELLYGVAAAIEYPAWMGLFTRNMEKGKESFIWSLQSTPSELASAATAAIGGLIAERFGFNSVFIFGALVSLIGSGLLVAIYPAIEKRPKA